MPVDQAEGPPLGREEGSLTDEGAANLFEGKIDWFLTAGMAGAAGVRLKQPHEQRLVRPGPRDSRIVQFLAFNCPSASPNLTSFFSLLFL